MLKTLFYISLAFALGVLIFVVLYFRYARKLSKNLSKLSEKLTRYREYLDESPTGICFVEFKPPIPLSLPVEEQAERFFKDSYYAEMNKTFKNYLMRSLPDRNEFVGTSLADFAGPSFEAIKPFLEYVASQSYYLKNYEDNRRNPDGSVTWRRLNSYPQVRDGHLVSQWTISEDITTEKEYLLELERHRNELEKTVEERTNELLEEIAVRKKTEEMLAIAKDLRKTQRIAKLGSWRLDMATNQVVWTDELYKMFGLDSTLPPPLFNEQMKSLFTPESWERLLAAADKIRNANIPYEIELEIVRKDGSHRWVWGRGETEKDSDGNIIGLWGAVQDITERKQAELALKESEDRFKVLHNASFGGIAIHENGIILDCNKGLSDITGYEYNELIRMDGLSLISEDTRDKVIHNINTGCEISYEVKGVRKNGELYPLRLMAKNIPYKGKDAQVVEFRDLTESKRTEEEKANLERQLIQAQKMEAVGRLAGGVAHDFNNMLSVILGRAGLALDEMAPDHPLHDTLKEIIKAGNHSADLTRQLLAFARKQIMAPKVLDINKTVEGMTKMLWHLIGEDIDLVWRPGDKVWPVKMDPSQVDQILANLCVNARDAIADVGKITIETANTVFDQTYCADHVGFLPGEYVMLAVSDNGCGMDTETLNNIFEPFFTTKESGKGTGLGLAMIYGIVKQNNGFVNVYSEPGHGTTFKIYLSRHLTNKTTNLPENVGDQTVERGNETILLVEDDLAILEMTKMMLEKLGYTVVPAKTPGEAIYLAQESTDEIHLLLTDVVMPEMNGRDLAKNILSSFPNLKRLFMSGYTANVIAHHGVLNEGVNFIQKPFSIESLGAKVRESLDKGQG